MLDAGFCFILNPAAGGGFAGRNWTELRKKLRDAGIEKEIRFTPAGGAHGFHFITTGETVGEGGDVEIEIRKLGPGEEDSDVVVIEKKIKKVEEN